MHSKKKITAFILIVSLIFGLLPHSSLYSEAVVYRGILNGDALIKNASYTDIKGNANAENIMKMSIYSIVREYGKGIYRPNTYISRQDALAQIVRAIGKQDEAVNQANKLKQKDPTLSSVDAYIRGHIEVAKSSGIIKPEEITTLSTLTKAEKAAIDNEVAQAVKKNWKMTKAERDKLIQQKTDAKSFQKAFASAAAREDVALWIARALALQPIKGEKTMQVYAYKDWRSLKTQNIPYVEAVLREGIMKGATAANFSPRGNITRGDMASIMNRVAAKSLDALQLTTGYGRVIEAKTTRDIGTVATTTTTNIAIQPPSGDVVTISVKKVSGKNAASQETVPVLKNGRIGNEALIAANDIVEYTLTKDNQALLLQVGPLRQIKGKFGSYNPQQGTVSLTDEAGKKYTLKVLPDSTIRAQQVPVAVSKIEANSPMTAIYEGSSLRALDVDLPAEKVNTREISVKIMYAEPIDRTVKIKDENGNMQYLTLDPNAPIMINDEKATIDDIGFDQDAVLRVSGGKILELNIYTDLPDPDEQVVQKVFTARVREVVGSNLVISTDDNPDTKVTYAIDDNTVIIKDKKAIDKSTLRPGDRIKVYVNSDQDKYITRVEVQSQGVAIEKIYKGDIQAYNENTGELVLTNVYTYGYMDWTKKGDYLKYKLADDVLIYKSNNQLPKDKLKENVGKTIYAVSKKNYGEEQLVQMVVKDGYEDTLYKQIKDIKWSANQMTLSDDRILGFQNGTIIVKDGRLMDTVDLAKNTGAFIIQNKTPAGATSAQVISLDSFNAFNSYRITKGYLHGMGEDYFTVENGYRLTNNEWQKWGEFIFQFSDDTHIFDNVVTNSFITADKFAESRYKPYTYTWPNFYANYGKEFHEDDQYHKDYTLKDSYYYHEHCQVYTVTDEYGNTQAVNIFKKDKEEFNPNVVHTERMQGGQIGTIDGDNNIISIKNGREYSPVYDTWQPVKATVPIDLSKAVILKGGKAIDINQLNIEDNVYILSVNGYAIFVFAE